MKKTNILVLILVLLLVPMLSLYSCDVGAKTIIGEVMYVKVNPYELRDDVSINVLNYHLYLKPAGQSADAEWIDFNVDIDTTMESDFCKNIEDMPELAIGATVEITFNAKPKRKPGSYSASYHVKNIRTVNINDGEEINNPEFDLVYFNNHKTYFNGDFYSPEGLEVVHVAKADCPEGGYIVYIDLHESENSLECYWIGSDTVISSTVESLLPDGLVGKRVDVSYEETYPFYNRNIRLAHLIRLSGD